MKHIQQYLKATLGVAFMAGSLVFTSCESDVIDLSPVNSLTDETAYATAERCKLSLIGAYDAAQCGLYNGSYSRGYPLGSAIVMQGEMRGEDMVNRAAFFAEQHHLLERLVRGHQPHQRGDRRREAGR